MSEENKELVRRSWAESGHNPDIFDEVYAPDALWHLPIETSGA